MRAPHTLVLAACLALAACGGHDDGAITDPPVDPRQLTLDEQLVVNANQIFGFNLLRQVARSLPADNIMISPLSVSMALGMTLNGADGSTFTELRSALGFGDISREQVNAAYAGLLGQLRVRDDDVEFTIANSVWHEQSFQVEPAFLAAARAHFGADVRALDFRSSSAPATINAWVSERTGGRIRDLVGAIKPEDMLFLLNAMYFKAAWTSPFDAAATRDAPFRRSDGGTVTARMMRRDGAYPFYQDETLQLVELLYEDSAYAMVLAAPKSGSVDALVQGLTGAQWRQWLERLSPGRIMLFVPKFEFRSGKDLNDELKALGMQRAFDPQLADFSLINRTRDDLHVSRVTHKTFISVDEEGTEAAAATSVTIGVTSMPPTITFDRPFFFAIRERSTGTVLFAGIVRDPTKS